MLTPPSFTKKSKHNTFTAELSTKMEMSNDFFLPLGRCPNDYPLRNDSFSFNTKAKEIFNPVENFSCVKKETPKFGRAENQTSTPCANMIKKLTLIRNQIRFEKSFNKVFNKQKNYQREQSHSKLFPGEKARVFLNKNPKKKKLARSSKKINPTYQNDLQLYSQNSSFLSKSKRVNSQKKSKKGPKIFGKKHLEIFHSKFNSNHKNKQRNVDNCISKVLKIKSQRNSKKRTCKVNYKENTLTRPKQSTPSSSIWSERHPMFSDLKSGSNSHQIKAKHLPKMFQEQFREQIINSFRNIATKSTIPSPKKHHNFKFFNTKNPNKNMKRKLDQSVNKKRNKKLNLRYQSARKCNMSSKKTTNLGLTQRKLNENKPHNKFLINELKNMIDNQKGRSNKKNIPMISSIDFRL